MYYNCDLIILIIILSCNNKPLNVLFLVLVNSSVNRETKDLRFNKKKTLNNISTYQYLKSITFHLNKESFTGSISLVSIYVNY